MLPFLFLVTACGTPTSPDPSSLPLAGLEQEAVRIASLLPACDDFSDLQPLKEKIGDARVVMLGEQSHGDGATFLAKGRLVRFLHQEMGFGVLAFESGLYDCRQAWERLRAGEDALTATRGALFAFWTGSREVLPTLEYLGKRSGSDRPLELAGFDCQFTGSASRESLVPDLETYLTGAGSALPTTGWWPSFAGTLQSLIEHAYAAGEPSSREEEVFASGYPQLLEETEALERRAFAAQSGFWAQLIRSLLADAQRWGLYPRLDRSVPPEWVRDVQMGRNLLWLADEMYPGQKIIVWAATLHIVRNARRIDTLDRPVDYSWSRTMGQVVREGLGEKVYTVGFIAYEGRFGRWSEDPRILATPAEGSLEERLHRLDMEALWLDLRSPGPEAAWIREPLIARPLGYGAMRADWGGVLDAMVYVREMTPSTRSRR